MVVGSCQHNPEQRSPPLYVHLEGHKAAQSMQDCSVRVLSFSTTEDGCSAFSCSTSPLALTDSSAAADQGTGTSPAVPRQESSQRGKTWQRDHCCGIQEELPIGRIGRKKVLSQGVCSVWLKASWDAGSTYRLRKRSSVSPRRVSLQSHG